MDQSVLLLRSNAKWRFGSRVNFCSGAVNERAFLLKRVFGVFSMLSYINHKEGDKKLAKGYFNKQETMRNRIKKMSIEKRDSGTVRSKVFVNQYIKVLQSLGIPDQ